MSARLHTTVWLQSALLSASAVAASEVFIGDVEPNDTLDTATVTGLAGLGTAIVSAANIGNGPLAESDRDLFRFEVPSRVENPYHTDLPLLLTVAMEAEDKDFDGYVRVFAASGVEIAHHDDVAHPALDPLLHTYVLEPGSYYVGVSHALNPDYEARDESSGRAAGTGAYDLAIVLSPSPPLGGSLEPNDDEPTTVGTLPYSVSGQFIGDGPNLRLDVDRYAVSTAGAAILSLEVTPSGLRALDPFVTVVVGGETIEHHAGLRRDLSRRRMEVAVFEAGTVEVVVKGTFSAPASPDTRFGGVGFYDLEIDLVPVESGGGPLEPNDSLLEATAVGLTDFGHVDFSAYVGDGEFGEFRGDVDFFEVALQPQEALEVTVMPGAGALEPVVHLYNHLGQRVRAWYADGTGVVHGSLELRCGELVYRPWAEEEFEETIGIAVMGARDRLTMDPLIPNPELHGSGDGANSPPFARHALDGGPGSVGPYDVTFTISPSRLPVCGLESDDAIGEVADPVLVDQGEYICGAGALRDGSCPSDGANVDLIKVQLDSPPAALDVLLVSYACGGERRLRVFDDSGNELATAYDYSPAAADIHVDLNTAGAYYIGVSASSNKDYDPFVRCSGGGYLNDDFPDRYELEIRLLPPKPAANAGPGAVGVADSAQSGSRLFGTVLDSLTEAIAELNPVNGETIRTLPAPEAPLSGAESLAVEGDSLLFLGRSGRFPFLYRLDGETGDVLDRALTWFGSGIYGGMAQLAGTLYIVDILEDVIHVVTTDLTGPVTQLDVGTAAGVSMFGPITATAQSDRLIVTDAADPSILHEIDAATGALVSSSNLGSTCPCDGDFDGDGDVDEADAGFLDACDAVSGVPFGCRAADLNCDGDIDEADSDVLACQQNGPNAPPNEGCCAKEPATVSVRATSLAAAGPNVLLAGDWTSPGLHRFSRTGDWLGSVALDAPVGALTGIPLLSAGDWDVDGDLDLIDWSALQICFTGDDETPADTPCQVFDMDLDADVDLHDFGLFQSVVMGVKP